MALATGRCSGWPTASAVPLTKHRCGGKEGQSMCQIFKGPKVLSLTSLVSLWSLSNHFRDDPRLGHPSETFLQTVAIDEQRFVMQAEQM